MLSLCDKKPLSILISDFRKLLPFHFMTPVWATVSLHFIQLIIMLSRNFFYTLCSNFIQTIFSSKNGVQASRRVNFGVWKFYSLFVTMQFCCYSWLLLSKLPILLIWMIIGHFIYQVVGVYSMHSIHSWVLKEIAEKRVNR